MKFNSAFGEWLKLRRKALDLTQLELADQVGCAVVTIRKFERDLARPSKQIANRLADVLALSPDERTHFMAFARHAAEHLPAPPVDQQPPDSPDNLPQFATPFIGRTDEIGKLVSLLDDRQCRLLTLTGPGGIGKTRLAIQVAMDKLADFPEGVYFVPLAPLSLPEQIVPAIGNTIGLLLRSAAPPLQQLIDYLRDKHLLLILDNFEHLLAGTAFITVLLNGAEGLKCLVTSRETLNLQEEWVRQVKGMPLPPDGAGENIAAYGAIQLFIDRARRVRGDFSLIDEQAQVLRIGRLVGGMPLAIELAAAWLKTMNCEQIADAIQHDVDFLTTPLRNIPERHRSIRAAFERSWQLLTDEEQTVFRKLNVFRGGFTPIAAHQVAGASLRTLSALTDKSLLQLYPNGRYNIHELLHQYGTEQLEMSGEVDATQQAHARYCAAFMQQLEASLKGRELPLALNKIKVDWNNVRTACSWIIKQRDFKLFDQLLDSLFLYGIDYQIVEVQDLWQQALDQFTPQPGEEAQLTWGRLLSHSADVFELRGPSLALASGLAHDRVSQALEIARKYADPAEIGHSLGARGLLFRLQSNDHEALKWYRDSLSYFEQIGDRYSLGSMYHWIGFIERALGHVDASLHAFRQQLELSRAIENDAGTAWALLRIGGLHLDRGDVPGAERDLQESEMIHQKIGNSIGLSLCAGFSAWIVLLRGDFEQAQVKVETALKMAIDCGARMERQDALMLNGVLLCLQGYPDRARQILAEAVQIVEWTAPGATYCWGMALVHCAAGEVGAAQPYVEAQQKTGLAVDSLKILITSLAAHAMVVAHKGASENAVELLGMAFAYPDSLMGWMMKWPLLTKLRTELEAKLGVKSYQTTWERGATLDIESVVCIN